jgi:hypothetical protein
MVISGGYDHGGKPVLGYLYTDAKQNECDHRRMPCMVCPDFFLRGWSTLSLQSR